MLTLKSILIKLKDGLVNWQDKHNLRKKVLFTIAYLIVFLNAYNQSKSLTAKLINADSVFLISHQPIPGSSVAIEDSSGKEISFPLIVNGRLNDKSVQEKVLLNAIEIKRLAKMLSYRKARMIVKGKCFAPHHAIIIINTGKLSYINLCFDCRNFSISNDVALSDIKEETWEKLYEFYRAKRIKYEMHSE